MDFNFLAVSVFEWAFWRDDVVKWLVFSVLAGAIAGKLGNYLEQHRNKAYEGWKLRFIHLDGKEQSEELYSEDVKRYKASRFELFKMVKSNLINFELWYVAKIGESPFEDEAWVREHGKSFVVDFPAGIKRGHIKPIEGRRG